MRPDLRAKTFPLSRVLDAIPAMAVQQRQRNERFLMKFVLTKGNIYVAERDGHVVIHRHENRMISTAAGTLSGYSGDGGPRIRHNSQPHSIALDKSDNVYVCDIMNHRVRRIDAKTGIIRHLRDRRTDPTPKKRLGRNSTRGPRSMNVIPDGTMYLILREGNKVFSIDPSHTPQTYCRYRRT
jgi:streptogramin lyase